MKSYWTESEDKLLREYQDVISDIGFYFERYKSGYKITNENDKDDWWIARSLREAENVLQNLREWKAKNKTTYPTHIDAEWVGHSVSKEVELHSALIKELHNIFMQKNMDYGNSFVQTYLEEGMASFRIRLTDKLERFKKLSKTNEQSVLDESIRDTLMDMANYALMGIICMEEYGKESK